MSAEHERERELNALRKLVTTLCAQGDQPADPGARAGGRVPA